MKLDNYLIFVQTKGLLAVEGALAGDFGVFDILNYKSFDSAYIFSRRSTRVPILFDLKSSTAFEKIVLTFDADDKNLAQIERIDIFVKSSIEEKYRRIDSRKVDKGSVELSFEATARFIRLDIHKGEWTKFDCDFDIYGTRLSEETTPLTEEQYKIEWLSSAPKVDVYGQYLYEEWPGKIHSDEDLISKYKEEIEYLKHTSNSKYERDEYGGIIDGNNYGSTGFFRTQKIDGKWWFITPVGNKFIMKGTEYVSINRAVGCSRLKYHKTDVQRTVYEELPDPKKFPEIYYDLGSGTEKGKCVNLLLANIIKKYGKEKYLEIWRDITLKRLKKWNFNTHAKWVKDEGIKIPYACSTDFAWGEIFPARITYAFDPYDSKFEENIINSVKTKVLSTKDDPLLIGYYFTNEKGWSPSVVKAVLEADENTAAKRAFVEYISEKYNDIKTLSEKFGVEISEVKELENIKLNMEALSQEEINEFIFLSSVRFHSIVKKIFKKLAPNHLYMGGGVSGGEWRNSIPWVEGSAEYCDVISFDRYNADATYIDRFLHIDRPMANIEWSFITNQRGYSGGALQRVLCNNQSERAELYKDFIEAHMKKPQFVGMGWFLHYDQSIVGRGSECGEGAEAQNFGLVDFQDTPYYEFVDKIAVVNDELEKIHENGC